jgi:enoyl-CoA hydratase
MAAMESMVTEREERPNMGEAIVLERDGNLAWLILNRPERLNAINPAMLRELDAALTDLREDDSVRVVALRGAGRAFSSGFDLSRPAPQSGQPGEAYVAEESAPNAVHAFDRFGSTVKFFERIWDYPKPVIAAVHGYCLAGATQLCLSCDITVVADDAQIGFPSIPVGGGFISPMWMLYVGPKRAKQMSFVAGSKISGTTAADWGWANYSVPAADLVEDVTALARSIAKTPPGILRMKKYSVNRAAEVQGFRTIPGLGAETDALLHSSDEVREMQGWIRSDGVKGAIRRFEEGE